MKRLHLNKTTTIILMMVLDVAIVVFSAVFCLQLRFDISNFHMIPYEYLHRVSVGIPGCIVVTIAVMWLFRLYNRVWSYASMVELWSVFLASVVIEGVYVVGFMLTGLFVPRSWYILDGVCQFMLFATLRFSRRIQRFLREKYRKQTDGRRIMVVGAGSAANLLIREMKDPKFGVQAVCAIDDNKHKKGMSILDVPIVGGRELIGQAAEEYMIEEIIIAMPSVPMKELKQIIRICQETGAEVKILPSVSKSLTHSLMGAIRPINYEDLLGREPVRVDESGISGFISGRVVLVTGGGGSIGSELCRQIAAHRPQKLVIVDIYENNAYGIQMELERTREQGLEQRLAGLDLSVLIASVRDYDRMEAIFAKYRPDIVYHAAAHKHVPLMEKSPNEAIKNNCLGTLNVARLADKYGASNFALISTDKAVRPTNVMGASKRICEMIVQTYAKKSEKTRYSAVRFGNVLGSNGSVIPLFLKQIEEGGPVTVTHREITRFFMTIPEAVSLVLQASLYASGGEIFVLDMGQPVKIYDLAENLIRLKGFKPGEDIPIEIVGLRPGEKLYEEILMDEEGLQKTDNDLIYIGKPLKFDQERFLGQLDELIHQAMENGWQIKEKVEEVCETYTITDNAE